MSELKEPRVGEEAPGFTLPNQNGEEIFLGDFRGRKVVLYFYPKDFTSGCTKEACSFRDSYSDFQEENTVILGISKDSVESHKKFETRYGLPFMLLSDKDADVAKMYGVWKEKNMYGRKYWGVVRSTFLIDGDSRIAKIYRAVKVEGHQKAVLDEVKALT